VILLQSLLVTTICFSMLLCHCYTLMHCFTTAATFYLLLLISLLVQELVELARARADAEGAPMPTLRFQLNRVPALPPVSTCSALFSSSDLTTTSSQTVLVCVDRCDHCVACVAIIQVAALDRGRAVQQHIHVAVCEISSPLHVLRCLYHAPMPTLR
jgi:hypothetical protein